MPCLTIFLLFVVSLGPECYDRFFWVSNFMGKPPSQNGAKYQCFPFPNWLKHQWFSDRKSSKIFSGRKTNIFGSPTIMGAVIQITNFFIRSRSISVLKWQLCTWQLGFISETVQGSSCRSLKKIIQLWTNAQHKKQSHILIASYAIFVPFLLTSSVEAEAEG